MRYFDNASTTYPKPEEVYRAQDSFFRRSANPGRAVHSLALDTAKDIFEARLAIAQFLGIRDARQLIFTGGCTQSLNMALKGMNFKKDDVILTSALEHNAVMRPLRQLEKSRGIKVEALPYTPGSVIEPDHLKQKLKESKIAACVFMEASNVTGEIVDLQAISKLCNSAAVPLIVDAAQSAGSLQTNLQELDISIWCAAGHKGLMGSAGVGLLYVHPSVELEPLISGGTGSQSENLAMPIEFPDHLEAGTLPGPAIAGLHAGVEWLNATGISKIRSHELSLTAKFLDWAQAQKWIHIYGSEKPEDRVALVSFSVAGITPDRVADILDSQEIAVRPGLHCASLAHQSLGTADAGLVRVSFGWFNTLADVEYLCQALSEIAILANKN